MSVVTTACNLLDPGARMTLAAAAPERLQHRPEGATYLDLRGLPLEPLPDIDEERIAELCRVLRGLSFAAVDGAKIRPRTTRHSSAIRSSSMSGSGSNGSPRRSRYVAPSGRCCRRSGAAAASDIRAAGSNRLQAVVTTDINVPPADIRQLTVRDVSSVYSARSRSSLNSDLSNRHNSRCPAVCPPCLR